MEKMIDSDMSKLDSMFGYSDMSDDIIKFGESKSFSSLRPYLVGRNADDSYSEIPYEKGYNFLYYLESIVNKESDIDLFRKMLRAYFTKYKFKSIKYEDFKNHFIDTINEELPESKARNVLAQIDWVNWVEEPGFPKVKNDFSNKYANEVNSYLDLFYKDVLGDDFVVVFKGWHTLLKQYFLRQIKNNGKELSNSQYNLLSYTLNLKEGYNAEINFGYFTIALELRKTLEDAVKEQLINFLGKFGRLRYLRPLYIDFYKVDKQECRDTFERFKSSYHPIAVRLIELDLKQLN